MSFLKKQNDTFILCPFNTSHRVLESKMQYHISRCMKNYPDYVCCPFNACHRVKKTDFKDHVTTCPDKYLIRTERFPDTNHRSTTQYISKDHEMILREINFELGENWDE